MDTSVWQDWLVSLPGDEIRTRRKRLKLSQKELAAAARVNPETVNRVEANLNTRLSTITKLRQALEHADPSRMDTVSSQPETSHARLREIEEALRAILDLTATALAESWDGRTERRSGQDRRSA